MNRLIKRLPSTLYRRVLCNKMLYITCFFVLLIVNYRLFFAPALQEHFEDVESAVSMFISDEDDKHEKTAHASTSASTSDRSPVVSSFAYSPLRFAPNILEILQDVKTMSQVRALKYYDALIPNGTDEWLNKGPPPTIVDRIEDASADGKYCVTIGEEMARRQHIETGVSPLALSPKPQFCLLYSPAYLAGISMFSEWQFLRLERTFNQHVVSAPRCYRNKTTNALSESLFFNHFDANGKLLGKGVNVALLVTGDAGNTFQHFMAWIPLRYAMVHEWITSLIQFAATPQTTSHLKFFNITIATNTGKPESNGTGVQPWFWRQFGYAVNGVNRMNDFVNITLAHVEGWCAHDAHAYYAPLLIAPFVFNTNAYQTKTNTLSPMFSWNMMRSIRPYLSHVGVKRDLILYLDRGAHHSHRGVLNNDQVIQHLRNFTWNAWSSFELQVLGHDKKRTFDDAKEIYSRAKIIIGPHGGMFSNMVFMQAGSYVIEFNGWQMDDYRPYFHSLAEANGLHYYYIIPTEPEFKYFASKMTIDLGHLDSILSIICEETDCRQ